MTDTLREKIDAAYALDNESRKGFARLKTKQAKALPDIVEQPIAQPVDRAEVAAMIEAERTFQREVFAEAMFETLAEDRRLRAQERDTALAALSDEVRGLKLELAETQTTLGELRQVMAAERSRALDLPNVLGARERMQ